MPDSSALWSNSVLGRVIVGGACLLVGLGLILLAVLPHDPDLRLLLAGALFALVGLVALLVGPARLDRRLRRH